MNNWYVYKITNTVNNKQYIGVRKHANPQSDTYMGSGKVLKDAFIKYGIDKFEKSIIFTQLTAEYAYGVESFIVDQNYVLNRNTYNIKIGGRGGNGKACHIGATPWNKGKTGVQSHSQKTKKSISETLKKKYARGELKKVGHTPWNKGKQFSEQTRLKMSQSALKRPKRILSQQHKQKLSQAAKNRKK